MVIVVGSVISDGDGEVIGHDGGQSVTSPSPSPITTASSITST
jgi:hypothetical protein